MAHLVPMSPPRDYHVPSMTSFSISDPSGIGEIYAWGADLAGAKWSIRTRIGGSGMSSTESVSIYPGLRRFDLRGVRQGFDVALFMSLNGGDHWQQYSSFVHVDANLADKYVFAFANGSLPKSSHVNTISFYPFGSWQGSPAMSETQWMQEIDAAIGMLKADTIGSAVLASMSDPVVIYPHVSPQKNADSGVHVNPKQWDGNGPCTRLDEVLLHEFIHVIENDGHRYGDRWGFSFDKDDFLTVNATNVYSCVKGRALRKDHHGELPLPDEHFRDPKIHWNQQEPNYRLAATSAPSLVRTLSAVKGVWNPFKYLS